MRHFLANVVTYTIAFLLIAGAGLFAWMRSAQVVISNERTVLARHEPEPVRAFDWRALGERSYVSNCLSCHRRNGQGWDQYPGLGHTPRLFGAPGGREYVIDLHLYGLTSPRWRAPMPPMGHIQDVELAAVMNHVLTHFGDRRAPVPETSLYTPADVAARRGLELSPAEVNRRRPDIAG
jgi:mono/diheme cytochrome c family protein